MFGRESTVENQLINRSRTLDGVDLFAHKFERLADAIELGKPAFDELERVRPLFLRELESRVLLHNEPEFPPGREHLQILQLGAQLLARLRDQYLNCPVERLQNGASDRAAQPQPTNDRFDRAIPVIRALDAQSRLLRMGLRNRISIIDEQWSELAQLALKARSGGFMDESVNDEVSMLRANTARAMFVMPLLLRAAHLQSCRAEERLVVERLARRYAHTVGFRIDEAGKLRPNPHGPSIVIDRQLAVRLDTHRLRAEISRRAARLANGLDYGAVLPRGVSQASLRRLLATLQMAWGPADLRAVPVNRIDPIACSALFSLPLMSAEATASSAVRYEYGDNEGNTVIRLARKRHQHPVALQTSFRLAESILCNAWTVGEKFIEAGLQRHDLASLVYHCLVVFRPEVENVDSALALASEDAVWVGRLMSMSTRIDLQSARYARQQLTVRVWPFSARMVGLRFSADSAFEPVLYMKGASGSLDEHSVFLQPGSWSSKSVSTLRLPQGDIPVRFGNLIERGFRFDHVRLQIER